jgi:hypothetical protein
MLIGCRQKGQAIAVLTGGNGMYPHFSFLIFDF